MAANLLLAASAVDSKGVKFSQMMKDAFTKAMNHHTAATKGNANNNNNKTTWKTSRRNFVHAFVNLQSLGVPFFTAVISLVAWVILRPLTIFKRFFASVKSVYISLRRLILDLIHLLGEKKTVLVREPTKEKSIAWSSALSLADVKVVKDAFGVTVNDVLVAALTGALRRHIIERGEVVPYDVFCPIPVTLRKTVKDVESLQNNVAGVWHFLPTGIEDPVARLHEIHKRMEERKKNKIYIAFTVFNMEFWGRCPQSVATGVVNHYWGKSLAIITNVPGPQSTLYLGGAKITDIQIFGLQACYGGMAISIITYDGKVSISIVADRNENAIDTPARQLCDTKVLTQFEQDFKVYLDLARAKMETSKQ